VDIHDDANAPNAEIEGKTRIQTDCGRFVTHLSKGHYQLNNEPFTSPDPAAP
jgi:hypothetical protein